MTVIRGQVVDDAGQPVALAAVYVVSSPEPQPDISQLSGSDGSFAIAGRVPGTYVLGARSDAAGRGQTRVVIKPGDEEVAARLTLSRSG
jgi:hypothetical protein